MRWARLVLALLVVGGFSYACSEEWEGFVYPNKNDLTTHRNIGVFNSLEECRAAATATLQGLNALGRGDYECGLNCRYEEGFTVKICEATER